MCWTQQATLLKSGKDTIVMLPLKSVQNINVQLEKARVNKSNYRKLYKKYKANEALIKKQDNIILKKNALLAENVLSMESYNHNSKLLNRRLLHCEGMYERSQKKNEKYKKFLIGGGILSVGIISLILVSTL